MRTSTIGAALAACCLVVLAAGAADGSELQYRLPPGWVDIIDPAFEDNRIPELLIREARSGRYIIYAIDPESITPEGTAANFNVIEIRGSGRVTEALLKQTASMAAQQAEQMDFDMKILGTQVVKLGTVDIGETNSTMSARGKTVRLLQYLIPGKTMVATLTYACLPEDFDRYRPLFESSAMATTGAVAHGIDWMRALKTGAITGIIGGIAGLLVGLVKKKTKTAAPPSAAPQSSTIWECPTCKRRVPMRIDACRCGAPRPA